MRALRGKDESILKRQGILVIQDHLVYTLFAKAFISTEKLPFPKRARLSRQDIHS
jgi:hypothetical protein